MSCSGPVGDPSAAPTTSALPPSPSATPYHIPQTRSYGRSFRGERSEGPRTVVGTGEKAWELGVAGFLPLCFGWVVLYFFVLPILSEISAEGSELCTAAEPEGPAAASPYRGSVLGGSGAESGNPRASKHPPSPSVFLLGKFSLKTKRDLIQCRGKINNREFRARREGKSVFLGATRARYLLPSRSRTRCGRRGQSGQRAASSQPRRYVYSANKRLKAGG